METVATIENMRQFYTLGVLAYSPETGEEYSANPADYWDVAPGWVMRDANDDPMYLVFRIDAYKDVNDNV